MKTIYCPNCGSKLIKKECNSEGIVPYCEKCEEFVFKIVYPCVILLVVNQYNEVCVIRQSYGVDKYVLVAGFVKYQETLEQTIISEVKEEIDHDVISFTYINSYFQQSKGNLMIGFLVNVLKQDFHISNELKEAKYVSFDEALVLLENSLIARQLLLDYLDKQNRKEG